MIRGTSMCSGGTNQCTYEFVGLEKHTNTSNGHMDVPSIKDDARTTANNADNARTHRVKLKMQVSLDRQEFDLPGPVSRWNRVSVVDSAVEAENRAVECRESKLRLGRG